MFKIRVSTSISLITTYKMSATFKHSKNEVMTLEIVLGK